MHIATVIAALLAVPLAAAGMYDKPVVNLDAKQFKKVMANEHAAMVAFVAPWCGHCKSLGPEYTMAAGSLDPLIPFYAVDCDASQNKALCAEFGIKGFPTIKAFPKAGKGAARDYNGERKKGALVDYAKSMVPERVKKLRLDDKATNQDKVLKSFLSDKKDLPHALLVHPSQPSIPFLWKVLGHRLTGKAHLGYLRDAKSLLTSELGLSAGSGGSEPRLLFWEAGSTSPVEYEGTLKFNALIEWLEGAIAGVFGNVEKRSNSPSSSGSTASTSGASTSSTPSEDAASVRARRQAKLDEAERRDAIRRAKAAAAKAAQEAEEEEEEGGTPVDAPPAEPEEAAEDDEAEVTDGAEHVQPIEIIREREAAAEPTELGEGTPVDAAAPAPEGEEATEASDWDEWAELNTAGAGAAAAEASEADEHARDEL